MTKSVLCLLASLTLGAASSPDLAAQQLGTSLAATASLPDAPTPQLVATTYDPDQASSSQPAAQTTSPTPAQAQASAPQNETEEQRKARAAAELKAEESQRMAGIIPNFMAVNNGKALPITPAQKFQLFFKGAFDSYQFILAGIDAGIGQAEDSNRGFNQGLKGLARRYG